jgi:large subunit ribosomal protein L10
MQSKSEKVKFVEEGKKALQSHSMVGVLPLDRIPDRLVQLSRNRQRGGVKLIMGRRTLLVKILESSEKTKPLVKELKGTSAILLSNSDPFEVYGSFKANSIRLAAKPNQVAPEDINIQAGDTTIQPGQAVTELKQAGIDVQIRAGKVVIAKDKVLVKSGATISSAVAKALKTLDIMPFTANLLPSVLMSGNMTFTRNILNIDPAKTAQDVALAFSQALTLSLERGIVNSYTVVRLLQRGVRSARALGIEAKVYEPGIIDTLIENAVRQAGALNRSLPKPE